MSAAARTDSPGSGASTLEAHLAQLQYFAGRALGRLEGGAA